jgi:hypothetical protein
MEYVRWFLDYLRREGHVIRAAPFSFLAACGFVAVSVFAGLEYHHAEKDETQKAEIELLKARLDLLQPKVPIPSVDGASANLPSPRTEGVDSPDAFVPPTSKPPTRESIRSMTNEELRALSYRTASQLDRLYGYSVRKQSIINENKSLNDDFRATARITADIETSNIFREYFKDLSLDVYDELMFRLNYKKYSWIVDPLTKSGIIPRSAIDAIGSNIQTDARELP